MTAVESSCLPGISMDTMEGIRNLTVYPQPPAGRCHASSQQRVCDTIFCLLDLRKQIICFMCHLLGIDQIPLSAAHRPYTCPGRLKTGCNSMVLLDLF
ncbi:hypothetical protein FKM82_030182 [Ascaphus truei]